MGLNQIKPIYMYGRYITTQAFSIQTFCFQSWAKYCYNVQIKKPMTENFEILFLNEW